MVADEVMAAKAGRDADDRGADSEFATRLVAGTEGRGEEAKDVGFSVSGASEVAAIGADGTRAKG